MNPIAVFFEGDVHVAQRHLPYALHCCLVVDANKRTLDISTTTQDFPLPKGEGLVRVISLDYITKLIIRASAEAQEVEAYEALPLREEFLRLKQRLVWLPEGFVITPRSPSVAPDGWGLPDNTPGGPLREVIINRFEHNLYPDVMYVRRKDIANAKLGEELFSNYPLAFEPVFYALKFPKRVPGTDINFVGLITIDKIKDIKALEDPDAFIKQVLQTHRLIVDPAFEQEQATWFCHRPQLIEYLYSDQNQTAPFAIRSDFIAHVFHRTNQIRAAAGKLPLRPPLRGRYLTLSSSTVEQNVLGAALAHGSSKFTKGYEYFPSRISRVGADGAILYGENLGFTQLPPRVLNETESEYQQRVAEILVQGWRTSPEHYENMIRDYVHPSYPNSASGFLEADKSFGVLRADQSPPYIEDPVPIDSPAEGLFAAQHFLSQDAWVGFGNAVWYGDAGVVSWNGPSNPVEDFIRFIEATPGGYRPNYQCVFVKGYGIHVAPRLGPHYSDYDDDVYVIAAGAFVDETSSSTKEFYITALLCKLYTEAPFRRTYILTITPLSGDPIVLYSYTTETAIGMGVASVSPNGKKVILNIPVKVSNNHIPVINALQANFGYNYTAPGFDKIGVDLDFREFVISGSNGVFSSTCDQVHYSSVIVDVVVDSYLIAEGSEVWRYNYYKQVCSTTYKWQAVYDSDNNLAFAEVELDILTEQSGEVRTTNNFLTFEQLQQIAIGTGIPTRNNTNTFSYKSKIKFPTGYELLWMDVAGSVAVASGFALCFHHLDILHPTEAVYSKLDVVTDGFGARYVNLAFKAGDTTLFTVDNILSLSFNEYALSLGGRAGADILSVRPFVLTHIVGTGAPYWRICLPYGWHSHSAPNAEHTMANAYKSSYIACLYTTTYVYGAYINHDLFVHSFSRSLSPWVAAYTGGIPPYLGVPGYVQVNKLKYKDEYITFIGLAQSATIEANLEFASLTKRWNPFGPHETGYPRSSSDPTVFMLSSIDLKAITGVSDLSDNIYPLGVI